MLNAKLLLNLITVPYVPLLGPVNPDCLDEQLLGDIFRSGETNELLTYDKDRRWYDKKQEAIIFDAIHSDDKSMIVPILVSGKQHIKLLCYGKTASDIMLKTISSLRLSHPQTTISVIRFAPTANEGDSASIIFLKEFSSSDVQPDTGIVGTIREDDASGLITLAADPENSGFSFLAGEYGKRELGPTFVIREHRQVMAAIGPIDIMPDRAGSLYCLPSYFGVASKYRGHGYGSRVWRAAMSYASISGAAYLLLQTEAGKVAEYCYDSQGLVRLGAVITGDASTPRFISLRNEE